MSAEPPARKWLWHTGWEGPRAFWVGLSRMVRASNGVFLATVAWGFDDDHPGSWLPGLFTLHEAALHDAGVPEALVEARVTTKVYVTWLGFAVGATHKARWLVPRS